ncbi:MaoC family dehydratase N-terminal domain-containing protein [Nocardia sp. NPDC127579]|uniref:FAS1-like dehydratase domain-containing protein n=1 Tax=Nocardia sp. NPDC127579 TaxID=3345402 RepID=UPI003644B934
MKAPPAVGHRYRGTRRYLVTAPNIQRFARVTHNQHPAHQSVSSAEHHGFPTLVAPPVFGALAWLPLQRAVVNSLTGHRGPARTLHVGQTLRLGRLLRVGDILTADIHVEMLERCLEYDMVVLTAILSDQDGLVVQSATSTLISSTGIAHPIRSPVSDPRATFMETDDALTHSDISHAGSEPSWRARGDIADLTANAVLPHRITTLRPADIRDYDRLVGTEVSDDPFPRQFSIGTTPGLLRMALASGYITSLVGRPDAVTTYRAEFSHYRTRGADRGGAPIRFGGRITASKPGRDAVDIAIEARCGGRNLLVNAFAEVGIG